MSAPLLTTKLYIPPPRPNLVCRPRLIERLDEGLRLGRRLTLVSAPAGCGKTTLISNWLSGQEIPISWLSLDEGDNDPIRFLQYLTAALQQVDGRIGRTLLEIAQSPQAPPPQSLATLLINDMTAAQTSSILVLDDYHAIESRTVHEITAFLVEHQPPATHIVVATREEPPLPLARLRVRNQVTGLSERDLRFTVDEATAFLNETMGLNLSPEAISILEDRTEGWIASLQLAALALQTERIDAESFLSAFTGSDRYVRDYLGTEVLDRQRGPVREFLLRTAVLDRLSAPLCDFLRDRHDSREILDQLDRTNLFLIPLDNRQEWYRYHNFFAEFLRTSADPRDRETSHQKAAEWYEAHGYLSQAVMHALACGRLSGRWEDAERLIRVATEDMIRSSAVITVRGWLDTLPDERIQADGELSTYKGWVLTMTGEIDRGQAYARSAETRLRRSEVAGEALGRVLALRSFLASLKYRDYEAAIRLSSEALPLLGDHLAHWRIVALWAMAESQERTGIITDAIATFREARRNGILLGSQFFVAMTEMSLALSLNSHGDRLQAIATCEEGIARHTDETGNISPWAGLLYSRLGTLYYESNQLELSREYHNRALDSKDQSMLAHFSTVARALAAPTLFAQGETAVALSALREAVQSAGQMGLFEPDWFLAWEANIRMGEGDIEAASGWAQEANMSISSEPNYLQIESHVIYARLLMAQAQITDARRWLAKLERFAEEHKLYRALLSIRIQQAVAAAGSGDSATAQERMARAVEFAAPQGYSRAFLDEDRRVMDLLPSARRLAPAFVDQLMAFAGTPYRGRESYPQPLVEPLSDRELEVLRLIAAGLTNSEIADELVIAVGTVKRHLNHIYGKLDVHSRTQAVAKGQELRLL